jgi:TPR repeat protein
MLVRAGYPAAYDNLGSMYRDRGDLGTAVAIFRKGVALNDSDSMDSLADLINDGRVAPQGPDEAPIELYRRAAELGNEYGARGYQALVAKGQQAQQQQVQQLEQQRLMLQFMGTIMRNIH